MNTFSRKSLKRFHPNRKKKKKIFTSLLKLLLVFLTFGGLIEGGILTYSWLSSSPFFKVQKIQIEGLNHVQEDQVLRRMDELWGQSLLRVDLKDYQKRLEADPWIRKARLKKYFPHRLIVRVTEKQPACYISNGNEIYLADEEGRFISKAAEPLRNIPEMKGIHIEKWIKGDEREMTRVRHGLEFIQMAMKPNFLISKEDLTMIEVRSEYDLAVTIGETLFFFRYPFSSQQWFRFLSVKSDIFSKNINIENVDLRFSGKVIVRPQKEKI